MLRILHNTYTNTSTCTNAIKKQAWELTLAEAHTQNASLSGQLRSSVDIVFPPQWMKVYFMLSVVEDIGYSIFSPITFYHSDSEWPLYTGVHLKTRWNHIPFSIWQYIRNCKLPCDIGPDKISIMVLFNNVAIFILTFPFFILQTPLSHISVTASLKIQKKIKHKMLCIELYRMSQQT